MIKLTKLISENDEPKKFSNEVKRHFLEIVSTYNKYQEQMDRKSDIAQVAETLGGIVDAAQELAVNESDGWFDKHTVKRNMGELKKLGAQFDKVAIEANSLDQRLGGLYEDMGHLLSRYYKLGDLDENEMKSRLGIENSVNEGFFDFLKSKISKKSKETDDSLAVGADDELGKKIISKLKSGKDIEYPNRYMARVGRLVIEYGDGSHKVSISQGRGTYNELELSNKIRDGIKSQLMIGHTKYVADVKKRNMDSYSKQLGESQMGNIDVIAQDSKDFKTFTKSVLKAYPKLDKGRETLKWLEDLYNQAER